MYLIPKTEEIKKRREKNELSKHKLSLKAGLGGSAICRIENQSIKKVHYLRAREIARVLECDVKDIFEEETTNEWNRSIWISRTKNKKSMH